MLNQLILVGKIADYPTTERIDDGIVTYVTLSVRRPDTGNIDDLIKVSIYEDLISDSLKGFLIKGNTIGVKARLEPYKYKLDDTNSIDMLEIVVDKLTAIRSSSHGGN